MRWEGLPVVELVGLDPDPEAAAHPDLSAFHLMPEAGPWPVADAEFDLVISRYVLEHVAEPETFFAEAARVLRPGGHFVLLTPNCLYPPMILSRMLPHGLKQRILAAAGHSSEEDVYPTFYRANTARTVTRLAEQARFEPETIRVREYVPTRYLDWSLPGFLLATAYHVVLVRTPLERFFGASVLAVLRRRKPRPAAPRAQPGRRRTR